MKLYRFVASDNQKAMIKVQDILGQDAYIYSTHKIAEGIEVLAGVSDVYENETVPLQVQTITPDYMVIESLQNKLQTMEEMMSKLCNDFNLLSVAITQQSTHTKKNFLHALNADLIEIALWEKLNLIQDVLARVSTIAIDFFKMFNPSKINFNKLKMFTISKRSYKEFKVYEGGKQLASMIEDSFAVRSQNN
jgi:flagellar biosynthesis GTPase FlhF